MEVYLVRHGIAEDHSTSGRDFDRKLTETGKQKANLVAKAFQRRIETVDGLFHSPLIRAAETAKIFSSYYPIEPQILKGLQPEDHPEAAIREIRALGLDRLILVGHEPNLSHLAALLISGRSDPSFVFKKAGIAGIDWNGRLGELLFLLPPKFLI